MCFLKITCISSHIRMRTENYCCVRMLLIGPLITWNVVAWDERVVELSNNSHEQSKYAKTHASRGVGGGRSSARSPLENHKWLSCGFLTGTDTPPVQLLQSLGRSIPPSVKYVFTLMTKIALSGLPYPHMCHRNDILFLSNTFVFFS